MTTTAIIGMQWGDEGKGRIVDNKTEEADAVARYNGGNNAGHTVVFDGMEYKLHFLPSGIVRPGILNIIGGMELLEPGAFFEEIEGLKERGVKISSEKLAIDNNVNVIMPWHKALDGIKGGKIDTTKKGIGPAYAERTNRTGIRVEDLLDTKLKDKIEAQLAERNFLFEGLYNTETFDAGEIAELYYDFGRRLKPYIKNTRELI